jgi:hypothetical protein
VYPSPRWECHREKVLPGKNDRARVPGKSRVSARGSVRVTTGCTLPMRVSFRTFLVQNLVFITITFDLSIANLFR